MKIGGDEIKCKSVGFIGREVCLIFMRREACTTILHTKVYIEIILCFNIVYRLEEELTITVPCCSSQAE